LKQGREIRAGGVLAYMDSAAVRAVKNGRILIIEGIEKAERGIMPVLNNLLENREMNLDDGTHIVHPTRHALMRGSDTNKTFISAHTSFRVIALGVPVPPYTGFPLDPPFRSRFQARFLDSLGSLVSLSKSPSPEQVSRLFTKMRDIIFAVQHASELRNPLEHISRSTLPPFPQNSLQKLSQLLTHFPPPETLAPDQLARLVLTLHPLLAHAAFEGWALLGRQFEEAGLGILTSPSTAGLGDGSGFLGYKAVSIHRVDAHTARVTFEGPGGTPIILLNVPAGPLPFSAFPPSGSNQLIVSSRFLGALTCFLQSHALGWDISFIPPVLPSTATCSTSLLVKTFADALGYEVETVHLYKELGGREILMRRKIEAGGATSWEPRYGLGLDMSSYTLHLFAVP
jgi:von Willebrand factor A domain-containing protein 8